MGIGHWAFGLTPNAQCPISRKRGNGTRRIGHAPPNGAADSYTYDALNRVLTHTAQQGGNVIYSSVYGYDLVGNRVSIAEQVADAAGGLRNRSMTYTYDNRYRLTGESWPTDGVSGETRTYAFDQQMLPVGGFGLTSTTAM